MPRTLQADQRARLLDVALRTLEDSGPEALQARTLTAEVGASTQAIYTLFGGMPGLFEALVADGFTRFARHVDAVPETDDPVADFFAKGAAYVEWALSHPQLYRLMFGLTGDRLRGRAGVEMTPAGALLDFPEGQAGLDIMIRALERAREFLSATHGYVLLEIAGMFGEHGPGAQVMAELGINLMVGLGDEREKAGRSLLAAARR
jgi:AcrR family transcriptional regulator